MESRLSKRRHYRRRDIDHHNIVTQDIHVTEDADAHIFARLDSIQEKLELLVAEAREWRSQHDERIRDVEKTLASVRAREAMLLAILGAVGTAIAGLLIHVITAGRLI